jgi:hypothetical protein
MSDGPDKLAAWIKTHWKEWLRQPVGPTPTLTALGGLTFFACLQGQEDLLKYGGTALGALFGYGTSVLITDVIEDKSVGKFFDEYANDFVNHTMTSLIVVSGTTFVTLLIFQIFGGEILDLIPGVDVISIGFELAVGLTLGFVFLPWWVKLINEFSWLEWFSPLHWFNKIFGL